LSGSLLGIGAAAIVLLTGVIWFRRINAVRIPHARGPYLAAVGVAVLLGLAAFAQGPGIIGGIGAGFAILAGGAFLGLRLQSSQDARKPAVETGGPILDFTAPDDTGRPFDLASLRGKPFLLKFFRGHW
jgi:hypothetical protein